MPLGPESWIPMGRPWSVNPAGIDMDGPPGTVVREQERIHVV